MTAKKGKYICVMLRLPYDTVALLRARYGDVSLYALARDTVTALARGELMRNDFTTSEVAELSRLAGVIGFADASELLRHLAVAYLRLYNAHCTSFADDVVRDEVAEMFDEMTNNEHYDKDLRITTTPRKIRGL